MSPSLVDVRDPGPAWILDAGPRVRGHVGFVTELTEPGMLHARLLRSRVAHGRIVRIDVTSARAVPGVRAVLTGEDLLRMDGVDPWFGPVYRDQPALALGKVRYAGEPIAAVAADDPDAAAEAIDAIDVEIEELPAVFDLTEALAAKGGWIHEEPRRPGTYSPVGGPGATNVCHRFRVRKGDPEAVLSSAELAFEDTFVTPAIQHVPLEAHACLARFDDDRVTVYSATQTPHGVRAQLAELLGCPRSRVRVVAPPMGGAFGGKGHAKIEPITVLLARASRRPVRLMLDRAEEFVTLTRHRSVVTLRTAVAPDGRLLARSADCRFDTGAYADIGPRVAQFAALAATGPYAIDHVAVDAVAVYTNLPPAGAFRGFGFPQMAWAHEGQMDMIAERLGLDPVEIRLRNLLRDGDSLATGEIVNDCRYTELLEGAVRAMGRPASGATGGTGPDASNRRVRRGIGFACVTKATVAPTMSTVTAKLNDDGSLDVSASSSDIGQGVRTAFARIAAAELDISPRHVQVSLPDTDVTPFDQMTSASRSTFAGGGAVSAAVVDIRCQLLELASAQLEVDERDLELVGGVVRVKGQPDRTRPIGALVRASGQGNLLGRGVYQRSGGLDPDTGQGVGSVHWSPGVGAAEVEVDVETGRVTVLRYHAATYAGRIINPVPAELQLEGCVAFGLGQALYEELVFDQGQLLNGSLADYMLAGVRDLPAELTLDILEDPQAHEIHGLGESAMPPVAPAIANAVFAATGSRIAELPITAERVLRALAASSGGAETG